MINIRRVLAVAVIPFVIGTFGIVAPNQAIAAHPRRHPQLTQPQKPILKHPQPRPQQKKRFPQPHQQVNHNQPRPNNRWFPSSNNEK